MILNLDFLSFVQVFDDKVEYVTSKNLKFFETEGFLTDWEGNLNIIFKKWRVIYKVNYYKSTGNRWESKKKKKPNNVFLAVSNQKLQGRAFTRFRSKGSPPISSNIWSNCAVLFFRQTGKRRKWFDEIKNFLCYKTHLHNFLCKLQQTEVDFACSQRVK